MDTWVALGWNLKSLNLSSYECKSKSNDTQNEDRVMSLHIYVISDPGVYQSCDGSVHFAHSTLCRDYKLKLSILLLLLLLLLLLRTTHVGSNVNSAIDSKEFIFLCPIEWNLRMRKHQCER